MAAQAWRLSPAGQPLFSRCVRVLALRSMTAAWRPLETYLRRAALTRPKHAPARSFMPGNSPCEPAVLDIDKSTGWAGGPDRTRDRPTPKGRTMNEDDLPNLDGCIRLICAVARQWAREAAYRAQHGNDYELRRLALWLGVAPSELSGRLCDGYQPRVRGNKVHIHDRPSSCTSSDHR